MLPSSGEKKSHFRSQQKLTYLHFSNALLVTADHLKTNDLKTKLLNNQRLSLSHEIFVKKFPHRSLPYAHFRSASPSGRGISIHGSIYMSTDTQPMYPPSLGDTPYKAQHPDFPDSSPWRLLWLNKSQNDYIQFTSTGPVLVDNRARQFQPVTYQIFLSYMRWTSAYFSVISSWPREFCLA